MVPQTVLFFGGPDALRRDQEDMLQKVVAQKGYTCRIFNIHKYPKKLPDEKRVKTIECAIREDWDFFVASEISLHLEETKQMVNLLLRVPKNRISAIMIGCSSGRKTYDTYAKESWQYLQVESPSVGVFRISGNGTSEEIHKRVRRCISLNNKEDSVDRLIHPQYG